MLNFTAALAVLINYSTLIILRISHISRNITFYFKRNVLKGFETRSLNKKENYTQINRN